MYLESFYANFVLSGDAFMLQMDFFTSLNLKEIVDKYFDKNFIDVLKECGESWDSTCYMNYDNIYIEKDGIQKEIMRFVANDNSQANFYEYNNLYKKSSLKYVSKYLIRIFAIYTVLYWSLVSFSRFLEKDIGNQLTKRKRK